MEIIIEERNPVLPDFFNPDIVIEPFKGDREKGTPSDAVFSIDGKYFFSLSQTGEIVAFETPDFKEFWKGTLHDFLTEPDIDDEKKLIFLKHNYLEQKYCDTRNDSVSITEDVKLISPQDNYTVSFMDNFLHFKEYKGMED